MSASISSWISLAARLVLAAVWLWAGLAKAVDPEASVAATRAYRLLPQPLNQLVGWALPYVEIALGLFLLAGLITRWAGAASLALFVTFIAGIVQAWARGFSIDCGCFGGGGDVAPGATAYVFELVRDIVFAGLAGWLTWRPDTLASVDRVLGGAR